MSRKSVLFALITLALVAVTVTACGYSVGSGGPTVGTPTTGPTQGIVVEVGAVTYGTGDTIAVTVRNNLSSDIIATDHQTSCTIVRLQMQVSGTWQDQGGCTMGIATRRVTLAAGSSTSVQVTPGGGQLSSKPWTAGTYRVAFAYQPAGSSPSADAQINYSAQFTVR